jgi:hypothetical protein
MFCSLCFSAVNSINLMPLDDTELLTDMLLISPKLHEFSCLLWVCFCKFSYFYFKSMYSNFNYKNCDYFDNNRFINYSFSLCSSHIYVLFIILINWVWVAVYFLVMGWVWLCLRDEAVRYLSLWLRCRRGLWCIVWSFSMLLFFKNCFLCIL